VVVVLDEVVVVADDVVVATIVPVVAIVVGVVLGVVLLGLACPGVSPPLHAASTSTNAAAKARHIAFPPARFPVSAPSADLIATRTALLGNYYEQPFWATIILSGRGCQRLMAL
jgi:hypothetical protein